MNTKLKLNWLNKEKEDIEWKNLKLFLMKVNLNLIQMMIDGIT